MSQSGEDTEHSNQTIFRRTPHWLVGAVFFAFGLAVGAIAVDRSTPGSPRPEGDDAMIVGCGADVGLIIDVDDLEAGRYELRASVGDRMLPMINSMTFPIVGEHRQHQWVVPDEGRLLLVARVPLGRRDPLRYELVGGDLDAAARGVLPITC